MACGTLVGVVKSTRIHSQVASLNSPLPCDLCSKSLSLCRLSIHVEFSEASECPDRKWQLCPPRKRPRRNSMELRSPWVLRGFLKASCLQDSSVAEVNFKLFKETSIKSSFWYPACLRVSIENQTVKLLCLQCACSTSFSAVLKRFWGPKINQILESGILNNFFSDTLIF